ncbi:MAG: DNA-directed RNA polymerase subunit omega [Opitutales bacterium]
MVGSSSKSRFHDFGKAEDSKIGTPAVNGNFDDFRGNSGFLLQCGPGNSFSAAFPQSNLRRETTLRDDYLQEAQKVITDPMILINVVSRRAKQLKSGYKPLIESLERLSAEDMALREIIEGKITYQLDETEEV